MQVDTTFHLLKRRRTKIVATLGPASNSEETITALIRAGVNVFRLNMSHGDHAGHRQAYERIRKAAKGLREHVAILADLCGPKIRVGRFAEGQVMLESGADVTVTTRDVKGTASLIPSQYEALAEDVRLGDRILLDDGNLTLEVMSVEGTEIGCKVIHGGVLKDRKGMNLPGVRVSAPSLTDKDKADAAFALELGVDLIALSFVRRASDVEELKAIISAAGCDTHVIAKIEKPEALREIEGILRVSDGIMVARGDLGVELPPEQVPVAQEQLVDLARAASRPVIVATQMLESMITRSSPTRAEVTDVAMAVRHGADAVMLSAETAAGAHPVAAVAMMDRIARQTEGYLWKQGAFSSITHEDQTTPPLAVGLAVARSTASLSRDLWVRSIVVASRSGTSATEVSSSRPAAPVIGITDIEVCCRRMALLWGVIPTLVDEEGMNASKAKVSELVSELALATEGEHVLVVRGFNTDPALNMPSITVLAI